MRDPNQANPATQNAHLEISTARVTEAAMVPVVPVVPQSLRHAA
jgi:hypothetical protein